MNITNIFLNGSQVPPGGGLENKVTKTSHLQTKSQIPKLFSLLLHILSFFSTWKRKQSDMGGDHHGHDHHHGFKIPDWRMYKVENAPELVQMRTALAQKGLSDPWIRNEVWRFDRSRWGTTAERWRLTAFRGFKWGFAAFLATIAVEKGLELVNPPADHGHGHH